ncbi:MAG: anthranilate synthase component II [Candidatus Puniceispirillaceae bacterium]
MFILIDNYDSFTWNLWHFLSDLGAQVETIRNDAYSADEFIEMAPQGFIISPGPGAPQDAGCIEEVIQKAAGQIPIFGVCLGMQAICTSFGGKLHPFLPPVHGKLSIIKHQDKHVFADVPNDIPVTRYHSLTADIGAIPDELEITAKTAQGHVMGLSHKTLPIHGVQFHPESIASVGGYRVLANFLALAGHNIPDEAEISRLEEQIIRLDQKFPEQIHQ